MEYDDKNEEIGSNTEEESESDGVCYLDFNSFRFNPHNLYNYDLKIDDVVQITLKTIRFSKKDDKSDTSPSKDQKSYKYKLPPKPIPRRENLISSKKVPISKQAYHLLKESIPMIKEMMAPLFWIVHLEINFPDKTKDIINLKGQIATKYREFLYPYQTSNKIGSKVIDRFVFCLPYFFTQAIQDIFIRLLCGNPVSMDRGFRMTVCSILVELFTGVKPIDSLLKARLSFYFLRPPEADIPDLAASSSSSQTQQKHKHIENDDHEYVVDQKMNLNIEMNMNMNVNMNVIIPTEDVNTLIDMPKRQRPFEHSWHAAAISPLIAKTVKRKVLPFTHDTTLNITLPKNGESDWTTELPPLLPPASSLPENQMEITDISKYNPQGETRSLLHRSRRPNIIANFRKDKESYHRNKVERRAKENYEFHELKSNMQKVRQKDPMVLEAWLQDLAKLQLEKKRSETPEFKRLSDILKIDEMKNLHEILKGNDRECEEKIEKQKQIEQEEKEEKEKKEENDAKFVYEPYFIVEPMRDESKKHEAIKPTYSKLFERSMILDNFWQ